MKIAEKYPSSFRRGAQAEVTSGGLITGIAMGTATVTAKYDSLTVTITLNVALASKITSDVGVLPLTRF